MKNPSLYISPWGNPKQKHALDVAFNGIHKYKSEISNKEKCKAVLSDIPTTYRRNRKKNFIDFALTAVTVIGLAATIMFMLVVFA